VLGPCIHAECYEFGPEDLDRVASRLGEGVRGTTSWGAPALDVPAAVRASLAEVVDLDVCTACSAEHWSHRARGEKERQVVVAWM
jgi:copper oxidase (laccase) domain-containing protein